MSYVRRFFLTICLVSICLILAGLYLRVVGYKYEINMEVASSAESQNSMSGSLLGARRLLGLQSGGESFVSPFNIYLQNLKTRTTAAELYKDKDLLKRLFPSRWDAEKGEWVIPASIAGNVKNAIAELVDFPSQQVAEPDVTNLYGFLSRKISIEERDFGKYRVSVLLKNRETGLELLTKLHEIADRSTKSFITNISDERIDLLSERVARSNNTEIRDSLVQTILSSEHTKTMVDEKNFSAIVFQQPSTTNVPTKPNPTLVLGIAGLMGLLISAMFILLSAVSGSAARNRTNDRMSDD